MDEDEVLLLNIALENVEDAEMEDVNRLRLLFHNREDPLERLSDNQFIKHFRLNKNAFQQLYEELTELLNLPNFRQSAITLKTKLLVALMFFGQGSYQSILGSNVFTGMSQASVSRCIEEITTALNMDAMQQRWIHFPQNMDELTQRRARFYNATHIPGGIGIIDCTHVAIVMPSEDEHTYINRKNYHSLNVQLICDERLRIMHVNSQFPGSTHDAYIWNQSNISRVMQNLYEHDNNNNFFLLGDSGIISVSHYECFIQIYVIGYPLRPWLMTPLRNPEPGTPSERFNTRFISVRSKIEQCNGVLKNRFRCLLKHRVLHYKPVKAARIIKACVVLHNICINQRIPEPPRDEGVLNADFGVEGNIPVYVENAAGNVHLLAGRELRLRIINNHFN